MPETQSPDPTAINRLNKGPHEEKIQFSDGRIALGYRTPGDVIEWGKHKYTQNLDKPGLPGVALVGTKSGRRFALGQGVAVELPSHDGQTGRFNVDASADTLRAGPISGHFPDITIGEPWELTESDYPGDAVSDVVVDYRPGDQQIDDAVRVDGPNPFDHAREIVEAASLRMEAAGRL